MSARAPTPEVIDERTPIAGTSGRRAAPVRELGVPVWTDRTGVLHTATSRPQGAVRARQARTTSSGSSPASARRAREAPR